MVAGTNLRLRQRIELRYQFIQQQQKAYPIKLLCDVMQVSRSSYYRYGKHNVTEQQILKNKLLLEVKVIAKESQYSYGSRRMAKQLQAKGYPVGRYAARSLM